MTDRHAGYLVTLDVDLRDDDAQAVLNAICMIKGVIVAEPLVADPMGTIAENRARRAIWDRMMASLTSKDAP